MLLSGRQENGDSLLVLLGEMQGVFQEFLSLLHQEEGLLLRMDRQGIADITEQKGQVLGEMCRYEQQVMALFRQLASHENYSRLGEWLKKTSWAHATFVQRILQELSDLAQKIQGQGRKNEAITRRTQHAVREAINLIYTGLGTGPLYQGTGTLQYASVPGSVNLKG